VKITFFVFLSIYSRGDATASWAARHTTVCLDNGYDIFLLLIPEKLFVFICQSLKLGSLNLSGEYRTI